MSPAMMGALAEGLIPMAAGVVMTLVGFRVIGPKPGTNEKQDRWHAKFGRFFRVAGPLVVLVGLVLLGFAVGRERPFGSDGWSRHTTTDGACSVEFPQVPQHEVSTDGEEADRLAVAVPERNAHYSLTFSDVSHETSMLPIDRQFELLRVIFATSKKTPAGAPARLVMERVIADASSYGREYQFAVGDQFVTRIKVFINGSRVYRAIAVNPPDPALDRDAQRFIDSFRFEINKP